MMGASSLFMCWLKLEPQQRMYTFRSSLKGFLVIYNLSFAKLSITFNCSLKVQTGFLELLHNSSGKPTMMGASSLFTCWLKLEPQQRMCTFRSSLKGLLVIYNLSSTKLSITFNCSLKVQTGFLKLLHVSSGKPTMTILRACSHEPGTVNYPGVMIAPGQALTRVHMMICCPGSTSLPGPSSRSSDHYEMI